MRRAVVFVLAGVLWTAGGCHCSPVYAPYANLIDDLSDRPVHLNCLYVPELDLSRTGHPDWCRWRVNCWLDPCECDRCQCHEHDNL